MRAPGVQPGELLTRQARAERGLAHHVLGDALLLDVLLDAGVAQDLHGPLVRDVRARRVRGPAVLRDADVLHA
jgi:hypothetical protein